MKYEIIFHMAKMDLDKFKTFTQTPFDTILNRNVEFLRATTKFNSRGSRKGCFVFRATLKEYDDVEDHFKNETPLEISIMPEGKSLHLQSAFRPSDELLQKGDALTAYLDSEECEAKGNKRTIRDESVFSEAVMNLFYQQVVDLLNNRQLLDRTANVCYDMSARIKKNDKTLTRVFFRFL